MDPPLYVGNIGCEFSRLKRRSSMARKTPSSKSVGVLEEEEEDVRAALRTLPQEVRLCSLLVYPRKFRKRQMELRVTSASVLRG